MMVNRTIKLLFFVLLMTLLPSCVRQNDYLTSFHLSGHVVNPDTNAGLNEVVILFIDRGFDEVRSSDPVKGTSSIGTTNDTGVFDVVYNYGWGYGNSFYKPKPKKIFEVIFKKPGFKDAAITFQYDELPQKGNEVEINVGMVKLQPLKRSGSYPMRHTDNWSLSRWGRRCCFCAQEYHSYR
jgi:hypothetical protein